MCDNFPATANLPRTAGCLRCFTRAHRENLGELRGTAAAVHVFMTIRKPVLVLTSVLVSVFGGCTAAPPQEEAGKGGAESDAGTGSGGNGGSGGEEEPPPSGGKGGGGK